MDNIYSSTYYVDYWVMALTRAVTIRFSEEGVKLFQTENSLSWVDYTTTLQMPNWLHVNSRGRLAVLQSCIVLSPALIIVW